MSQYGYIYKTTNLINGRIYIGQHAGEIDLSYIGSGAIILKAIKKYGKENFKLKVIAFASNQEILNSLEIKYIHEYREKFSRHFLYNLSDGGFGSKGWHPNKKQREVLSKLSAGKNNPMYGVHLNGALNPMFGKKHSATTKIKIAKTRLKYRGKNSPSFGIPKSMEIRKKISETKKRLYAEGKLIHPLLGKNHSQNTIEKIRQARIEWYKNNSNSFKGRKHTEETKRKMRAAR